VVQHGLARETKTTLLEDWRNLKSEGMEWAWRLAVWDEMSHDRFADEAWGALLGHYLKNCYWNPFGVGFPDDPWHRELLIHFNRYGIEPQIWKNSDQRWLEWVDGPPR
jgi:hypothetical protein